MQNKILSTNQQKIALAFVFLFLLSIYFLRGIYIPILISYFLAFLLNPLVGWGEKRGFGRVGPILILLVFVFVGGFVLAALTLPKIVVQMRILIERFPEFASVLSQKLAPFSEKYLGYDMFTQWETLAHDLVPALNKLPVLGILDGLLGGTAKIFSAVLTLMMIPLMSFYFLKDFKKLNLILLEAVPRRYEKDVAEVANRLAKVLGSLIRGQFLVCFILAIFYTLALSAVGLEGALLMGIFSGFMNLVPVVGALSALLISIGLMIFNGGAATQCVAIFGVFLVGNLIESTLLTPRIVGKQMGISPLVIILALLAGAELLGFLGILLALPVLAMVKVLGGYFAERYYSSSYYKDKTT